MKDNSNVISSLEDARERFELWKNPRIVEANKAAAGEMGILDWLCFQLGIETGHFDRAVRGHLTADEGKALDDLQTATLAKSLSESDREAIQQMRARAINDFVADASICPSTKRSADRGR